MLRRAALAAAILAAPTAIALVWQMRQLRHEGGGILVAPFAVWSLYSPHIALSLLLSLLFPLGVVVLAWPAVRRAPVLAFAWSVLGVAVAQMALLGEQGPRFPHGNFFWGAYAASFVVFLESAIVLAHEPDSWRTKLAWGLLAAHASSGVLYLVWRLGA